MNDAELDAFLAAQPICRVASVGPSGPHVTPLCFTRHDKAVWLYSLTRSQRWVDIVRNPRIAVVVDSGHEYTQLRGVEISGDAEIIGEAPRTGEISAPGLERVEQLFSRKYMGDDRLQHDGLHGWMRIQPVALRSWDFRKM
jgi:general stress protein 26